MILAREYRSQITGDPQGRTFGNLVDAAGRVVLEGVSFVPTNVTQQGDKWRAQAANLVANLDEATGAAILAIDEGQAGAERGSIRHFRAASKPAALAPGRICVLPNGVAYIGDAGGLPSLLTQEINDRAPAAGDDATKGYKPGNVWAIRTIGMTNLLGIGYQTAANWATNGSVRIEGGRVIASSNSGSWPSGVSATLNAGHVGVMPRGHKIYIFARASAIPDTQSQSLALLTDTGAISIPYTGGSAAPIYDALIVPSEDIINAQLQLSARSDTSNTTVSFSRFAFVDLTAAMGAGNEYTLEEARALFLPFESWQAAYTVGAPALYMCLAATQNAAQWVQIGG